MSVLIKVIGSAPDSDEYQSAEKLKSILEVGLPHSAVGEIVLHANATLMGQTIKDVDLLMLGTLQNYKTQLTFNDIKQGHTKADVSISNFCTTIEIKSHSIEGIYREGTELYVKYGTKSHSVTYQSNQQKISAKNFFEQTTGCSPFITNLIWFTDITKEELKGLLTVGSKEMPCNALSSDFSAHELMQLLVLQRPPVFFSGSFHFTSCHMGETVSELDKVLDIFTRAKADMGELTRKRIEQITRKSIDKSILTPELGKMAIYRGRAGTGKTVGLIQLAIQLADEKDARVLILTYNRALVSDLRRLFALAELPDLFDETCISVNTMKSFFYKIARDALFNGSLTGEDYLQKYDSIIKELVEFLESGEDALDIIKSMLAKDISLNWDYCFLDEAQDWTAEERNLIMKLFDPAHIVVADGGQQFVRGIGACDWNVTPNRQSVKLKYCLRQKNNLIKFINHLLISLGQAESKLTCLEHLPGGHVIICHTRQRFFDICHKMQAQSKAAGNIPYDTLFLTPASFVEKGESEHNFKYSFEFMKNGFNLWDGTNENTRLGYPLLGDEQRLLQYDSARGLEAWIVICMGFDIFVEEKLAGFDPTIKPDSLFLESIEDRRAKYILNWILIPLTRAIDTIVLSLHDTHSPIGNTLRELALQYPDYIEFEED